jgi:hypothetical protein
VEQVIEEKGGIGVITRKPSSSPADLSSGIGSDEFSGSESDLLQGSRHANRTDTYPDDKHSVQEMLQGILRVEKEFHQQKELYHAYIKEMDSRADYCRVARISELKIALETERERNEKLALAFGRLQERYRLLLRKLQKKNQAEVSDAFEHQ